MCVCARLCNLSPNMFFIARVHFATIQNLFLQVLSTQSSSVARQKMCCHLLCIALTTQMWLPWWTPHEVDYVSTIPSNNKGFLTVSFTSGADPIKCYGHKTTILTVSASSGIYIVFHIMLSRIIKLTKRQQCLT